jgi:hypothetical protein
MFRYSCLATLNEGGEGVRVGLVRISRQLSTRALALSLLRMALPPVAGAVLCDALPSLPFFLRVPAGQIEDPKARLQNPRRPQQWRGCRVHGCDHRGETMALKKGC